MSNGNVDERISEFRRRGCLVPSPKLIKSAEQIEGIRRSGKVNIAILDRVAESIAAGMTTGEIDRLVHETTAQLGGTPAPLGFHGYPKSVCTSVDDQVCHGIPSDDVRLKDGDIVNVDVSTIYGNYFSDSSRMFCIGDVDEEKRRLVETARECMYVGLQQVKPWGFLGDIGAAVQAHAEQNGYSVVREMGGHGVGLEFHEEPFVGFAAKKGTGMLLVPGMVFTVEPMINMGKRKIYMDDHNGWTIYTDDGLPSAQWEATVLVTEEGHEILAY